MRLRGKRKERANEIAEESKKEEDRKRINGFRKLAVDGAPPVDEE